MSKFLLSVGQQELSSDIASLITSGRQIEYHLSANSIIRNHTRYMVELDGPKVIGVIGIEQVHPKVSELKHLCVHQDYRRRGIGKRLLERAANAATTEFVYGLVRSDNATNIRNNLRIGMKPIGKKRGRRGYLICFARRRNGD